jgi:hypothetical protein
MESVGATVETVGVVLSRVTADILALGFGAAGLVSARFGLRFGFE